MCRCQMSFFLLPWGGKSWENTEKENFLVLPRAAAISLSPTRQNNLCQDGRRRSSVRPSRGEKGVRSLLPSFFLSFSAPGLTLSSLSLFLARPLTDCHGRRRRRRRREHLNETNRSTPRGEAPGYLCERRSDRRKAHRNGAQRGWRRRRKKEAAAATAAAAAAGGERRRRAAAALSCRVVHGGGGDDDGTAAAAASAA